MWTHTWASKSGNSHNVSVLPQAIFHYSDVKVRLLGRGHLQTTWICKGGAKPLHYDTQALFIRVYSL